MHTPLHDRYAVYTAGFLRATANGLIGVIAGIYLARLLFAAFRKVMPPEEITPATPPTRTPARPR